MIKARVRFDVKTCAKKYMMQGDLMFLVAPVIGDKIEVFEDYYLEVRERYIPQYGQYDEEIIEIYTEDLNVPEKLFKESWKKELELCGFDTFSESDGGCCLK